MHRSKITGNYHSSEMVVCNYCKGSGLSIVFAHSAPDVEQSDCPKCNGEGRLMRIEKVETRPITMADKVSFRKVIIS
ncbi:MAG: hypothetical protein WCJ95_09585 [Mariniphaga sp.]